jgi:hypothetical protein
VIAMRRRAPAIAIAAVLAGCNDPSLRVEVLRAPGFDNVAATTITVYQTTETSDIDCFDIEIGTADPAELQVARVASAVVELGETLDGVSRIEPKLFVAEAVDDTAPVPRRLYAGCAARGEITDDEVVQIETHAIATITVSGDALDRPFARRIVEVFAIDALGRPIDERHVEWESFGVSGAFPPSTTASRTSDPDVCTDRGVALIEPADPDTPGPIAAQVRVSWAEITPPPLSGYIEAVTNQVDLREPGAVATRIPASCARRTEGAPPADHVYCLAKPVAPSDPRQVVELVVTGDVLDVVPVGAPVAANTLVATGVDGNADGAGDLYAIERVAGRVRWTGIGGTPDGATFDPCVFAGTGTCMLGAIRRTVIVPTCDVGTGFAVMTFAPAQIDQPDILVFTDLDGDPLADQPPVQVGGAQIELLAGGCVAETKTPPVTHQAFAARFTPMTTNNSPFNQVVALCDDGPCTARWTGAGAVGFSGGATPRLISSELDITGNVIVESEIVQGGEPGKILLVERGRTPSSAQARSIASADVDGDGREDLAWSQFLVGETGLTENRIQLAVDRGGLPFPGRLAGISPALPGSQATILFADLDDDGVPDLVSFSDAEAAVYPFGVEVQHGEPRGEETTCN